MQPSTNKIAHFVLQQLLQDSVEKFGSPYLIDSSGNVIIYRKGEKYAFAHSEVRLVYLVENSNYSLKQISEATNLLIMANKHIEISFMPDDVGFEHTFIKATPLGIAAFQGKRYNKFNYEKWTFWIQVVVGTLLALVAILLSLQ